MSRLSGKEGGGPKAVFASSSSSEGGKSGPSGLHFGLLVAAVLLAGLALAVILIGAFVYTQFFSASAVAVSSASSSTTSSTTTSTTQPAVTDMTTASTTTTTTTSTLETTTTSTEPSTTTSTLDKYLVASCMAAKASTIYLRSYGDISPSKSLENYLGEYERIFNIVDCYDKDNEAQCKADIQAFIDEGSLSMGGKAYKSVGYPVVVVNSYAYVVPSPAEFERVMGCGSLKG